MNSNLNSAHSPRSSHRHDSNDSNGLQLQDISHLPITYPSRSPSLHPRASSSHRSNHATEDYVDDQGQVGDDDDEWEIEHEYVNIGAADAASWYDAPPKRPHPIHRESQDVEFGNRLTSMRSLRGRGHGRPWDVNVRLPHSLARGKTALIKSLRGGFRRVQHAGHTHTRSHSNGSPPFEFRDPQPAPQSIRQQYAELAPPESPVSETQTQAQSQSQTNSSQANGAPASSPRAEMRTENGLLAPPATMHGPSPSQSTALASPSRASLTVPDANEARRHSRSQYASYHPPSQPAHSSSAQTLRPRSRSAGSRHSRHSAASAETTTLAPHNAQMYDNADEVDDSGDTAETTLVQHVNDLTLAPIHSPSKSSRFTTALQPRPRRSPDLRVPRPLSVARSRHHRYSRFGRYSKPKNSLLRALHAFQRLPWMAAPENPPGFLIPEEGSPRRIAKDFVPSRSDRAKLRSKVEKDPGMGMVYKKRGIPAAELEGGAAASEGEENQNRSWYRPSTRQVQRAARGQHYQNQQRTMAYASGAGLGGFARPVKQAYASYRAIARNGRPLDYMYAPSALPISRAASSGAASAYSTRHYGGYTSAHGNAALYGLDGRPGSIAAAASAYLTRSVSASASGSQPSSSGLRREAVEYPGSNATSGHPPPVPPKASGLPQSYSQSQSQQPISSYAYGYPTTQPMAYYTYNFAYPQAQAQVYAQRAPGTSPSLPPVPAMNYSGSGVSYAAPASGHGQGHGQAPVQVVRSASDSANGNIPTIPTASDPTSSQSSYSYTRGHERGHGHEHGHGHRHGHGHGHGHGRHATREGSGSSSGSGYGTIVPGHMRYGDYASAHVR